MLKAEEPVDGDADFHATGRHTYITELLRSGTSLAGDHGNQRTSADRQGSGRRRVAFVGISVCGFRETRARKPTSRAWHPETMPTASAIIATPFWAVRSPLSQPAGTVRADAEVQTRAGCE